MGLGVQDVAFILKLRHYYLSSSIFCREKVAVDVEFLLG